MLSMTSILWSCVNDRDIYDIIYLVSMYKYIHVCNMFMYTAGGSPPGRRGDVPGAKGTDHGRSQQLSIFV